MPWGSAHASAFTPIGRASGATLIFSSGGALRVVAIVKATFSMAQGRAMTSVDAEPLVSKDAYREGDPEKSLLAATDLAPYRPRADVLLRGHAWAPGGKPAPRSTARLMIARGQRMLLDKRVTVQGSPGPHGSAQGPSSFVKMPLVYELAARSPDNPVGVDRGAAWPNICDAWSRPAPVGFGPINPRWPRRRALLADPTVLDREMLELPAEFPWIYFQAAPEDQRIEYIQGDEWIGFEGMNAEMASVQSQLPGARGIACVYGPSPSLASGQPIALYADAISIDADQMRVSVVWRGSFPIARVHDAAALRVLGGVQIGEVPLAFPSTFEQAAQIAAQITRGAPPLTRPEFPAVRRQTPPATGPEMPAVRRAPTGPDFPAVRRQSPPAEMPAVHRAPTGPDFPAVRPAPVPPRTGPEMPAVRPASVRPPEPTTDPLPPVIPANGPASTPFQQRRPKHRMVEMKLSDAPPEVREAAAKAAAEAAEEKKKKPQTLVGNAIFGEQPATPFEPARPAQKNRTMIGTSLPDGAVRAATPFEQTREASKSQTIPTVKPSVANTPFQSKAGSTPPPPAPPSRVRSAGSGVSRKLGQTISLDLIHQAAAQMRGEDAVPFAGSSPPANVVAEPRARGDQPRPEPAPESEPAPVTLPGSAVRSASPLPFAATGGSPQTLPEPPPVMRPPIVSPPPPVVPPPVTLPPAIVASAPSVGAPITDLSPPPLIPIASAVPAEPTKLGAAFLAAMARAKSSTRYAPTR